MVQNQKYRINNLAKDFNLKSKDIVELLASMGYPGKTHMAVLESEEFNLVIDRLTAQNPFDDIDGYMKGQIVIEQPAPKAPPKAAEEPKPEAKPEAEAKAAAKAAEEPKPEAKPEAEAKAASKPAEEPKPEAKPETAAKAAAKTAEEPKPEQKRTAEDPGTAEQR